MFATSRCGLTAAPVSNCMLNPATAFALDATAATHAGGIQFLAWVPYVTENARAHS